MKFSVKKFAVDALKYGKLLNISEITIYILNSVNKIYSEIYQSAEILGFFKEICLLILVKKKDERKCARLIYTIIMKTLILRYAMLYHP